MSTWTDRRYFSSDIQAQTISALIQKSILNASEQTKVEDDLVQLGDLSDSTLDMTETMLARTYSNYTVYKLPTEPDNDRCRLWLHATNAAVLRDLSDFGGQGIFYGGIPFLCSGYDDGVTGNIQNPEFNGITHFIKVPDSGNIQLKNIIATKTGISFFIRAQSTSRQLLFGSNRYLFSKIDDDLVSYAYQAFYDDSGIVYFEVIQNGVTYAQKTTGQVIGYQNDFTDFAISDYTDHDFYANPPIPITPSSDLTDEFVFTYNFSTHAMQIYYNNVLQSLTSAASTPIVVPPALTPPAIGSEILLLPSGITSSYATGTGNADDSNLTTRWEQPSGSFPMYLQYDLGQIKTLVYCQIAWYGAAAGRVYSFEIDVSDDNVTFATVYTGQGQGTDALQRYDFPDTTGRYVKLNILSCSAGSTASVYEFQIYGYNPITSTAPVVQDYNVPVTGGDYFDLYQSSASTTQTAIFGVVGTASTDQKLMTSSGTTAVYNLTGAGSNGLALSAAASSGLVYNPVSSNNDAILMGNTTGYSAVGVVVGDSSSVLFGKTVTQVTVKLQRIGTISSGTAPYIYIGTFISGLYHNAVGTGSNTISANSVPTSGFTSYTFNISANNGPLAAGDIVYIGMSAYAPTSSAAINVLYGDPPTSGGDSGHTYFYGEDQPLNSGTWHLDGSHTDRTPIMGITVTAPPSQHIAAEYVNSTSSLLYNKAITAASFKIKKLGSPTGGIYCHIRKAGGTTIAADASISATDSRITTSFNAIPFTFTNNTYVMQLNDQVEIQYDGGDPSANNIQVQYDNTSGYDGTNSAIKYQDTGSVWYTDTASDICGTFSINNAAPFVSMGQKIVDNLSVLYGQIITKITVKLAKVGTLGAGLYSIHAYILLSGGTYTASPTVLDPSTLPVSNGTNYQSVDFDFSSNAHAGAVGDRIYIYFNGGDPSNYVVAQREVGSASGDGVHTIMTTQHPDSSWLDTTTDDQACTFYATTVIPATTTNRVALYLQGDFASLINHTPNNFTFYLKKQGAPTGTIYFRIRDVNNAIVQELGTYNPASLSTTTNTTINFTNIATFTRSLNKGDMICIEYTGGTSTDRVKVQHNSKSTYYTNPDTVERWYNNASWALVSDRVLAGIFSEGGQTTTQQWLDINQTTDTTIIPSYTHALYLGVCAEFEQLSKTWVLKQGQWAGVFAEFRVYQGILSQQEITNLYVNKRTIRTLNYGEVMAVPNIMKLEP